MLKLNTVYVCRYRVLKIACCTNHVKCYQKMAFFLTKNIKIFVKIIFSELPVKLTLIEDTYKDNLCTVVLLSFKTKDLYVHE